MSLKTIGPSAAVQDFPIVGIGASAGGLDAFRKFLGHIPEDSGMAFVLVQHLDPKHESILPEILSKATTIPLNEITDDIHLAPNHIYVIPENKILTSIDGVLKLAAREHKVNNAIDVFFTSLAEVHKTCAVGILLSGKGSDGTEGMLAIQEHGGHTFAQLPESAVHSEMPRHAIDAGAVQQIIELENVANVLRELLLAVKFESSEGYHNEYAYNEIIQLLHQHGGVDFTNYKQSTIRRRITRRMSMSKMGNTLDYIKLLKAETSAVATLFNDLLIPVTSFFRDPKIFHAIAKDIFQAAIENVGSEKTIRIWTAGCSTGQEAYSLAILLDKYLSENTSEIQVRIFASDISQSAIAKARFGFYANSEMSGVSDSLLQKYFTKSQNGYHVNRNIREMCVFAVHNVFKDPPFAKLDIITCRNVLIYFDTELQKKALETFHYALKPFGILILGKSETVGESENIFTPLHQANKFFSRNPHSGHLPRMAAENKEQPMTKAGNRFVRPETIKSDLQKNTEALLMANYTPASVVVNEQMDIIHIHGNIAPFLTQPQGKPTFNLYKMAPHVLAFELRNAILKVKETNELVVKSGLTVQSNDESTDVTFEIQPLKDNAESYFLIVFYRTPHLKKNKQGLTAAQIDTDENLVRIRHLENALAQVHSDVQFISEDHEAANEELQSANEELMSGSEELQSLNEELETSREELQSSNEELLIINQELLDKQEQINNSKMYTEAIVATLREPIVILNQELRIKNINRAFANKFSISKPEAEGKLIYEIQNHLFENPFMRMMLEKVLPDKIQLDDFEIAVNLLPYGESTMLLNARQMANANNEHLILLSIEDVTERRKTEHQLKGFSEDLEIKIKERTVDLMHANDELEATVKELNLANIQLQQFAYIASHDLQEPLRKITMFTSRLHTFDLPENAVSFVDKITQSSLRMRSLIQSLLEYSYLTNNEGLFVQTDLNIILKNILVDFELMMEQKEVVLKVDALPTLAAIPVQMNQLFYNMISNALKFTNETIAPCLQISAHKLTNNEIKKHAALNPKAAYYEVTFKDNGIGFEQKYAKQIFNIFQRLHNKDAYIGTGIGLAISKKIVDNHHGEIYATGVSGEGATFHVILPVVENN